MKSKSLEDIAKERSALCPLIIGNMALIGQVLDHQLKPSDEKIINNHVNDCERCQKEIENYQIQKGREYKEE